MTQQEYEDQYHALEEEQDRVMDSLEADPENEALGKRYNELTQQMSDLENSFGEEEEAEFQEPSEPAGVEPTESAEEEESAEPEPLRDERGMFKAVPYQPKPEQKKKEELAKRFPSMI